MSSKEKQKNSHKTKSHENNHLEEKISIKIFKPRVSLLTELLQQDNNLKTIYNLIFICVAGTVISTAISNYRKENRFYLGSKVISRAFINFDAALVIWSCLFLSSLLIYWGFITWAIARKWIRTKLWDWSWLLLYTLYFPLVLYYSSKYVIIYNLGFASSVAVTMEATRFLMKAHAFVRSNCPKYLRMEESQRHPTFRHYLYFSFAPTILYRDVYPKSDAPIRWRYVFRCFVEVLLSLLFISILFENAYLNNFKEYEKKSFSLLDLLIIQIQNIHVGFIFVLLIFYSTFECYLNATGEILGFSDRLFYMDWWTSVSPARFLNKWNIVVYDWFHMYIYKDCYENIFPNNKTLASLPVYLLSGIFHDYVLTLSCRVFIPMMVVYFLCVLIIMELQHYIQDIPNTLLWIVFGFIISGQLTYFTAELYAREYCPKEMVTIYDYLIPRLLYC